MPAGVAIPDRVCAAGFGASHHPSNGMKAVMIVASIAASQIFTGRLRESELPALDVPRLLSASGRGKSIVPPRETVLPCRVVVCGAECSGMVCALGS